MLLRLSGQDIIARIQNKVYSSRRWINITYRPVFVAKRATFLHWIPYGLGYQKEFRVDASRALRTLMQVFTYPLLNFETLNPKPYLVELTFEE